MTQARVPTQLFKYILCLAVVKQIIGFRDVCHAPVISGVAAYSIQKSLAVGPLS